MLLGQHGLQVHFLEANKFFRVFRELGVRVGALNISGRLVESDVGRNGRDVVEAIGGDGVTSIGEVERGIVCFEKCYKFK